MAWPLACFSEMCSLLSISCKEPWSLSLIIKQEKTNITDFLLRNRFAQSWGCCATAKEALKEADSWSTTRSVAASGRAGRQAAAGSFQALFKDQLPTLVLLLPTID